MKSGTSPCYCHSCTLSPPLLGSQNHGRVSPKQCWRPLSRSRGTPQSTSDPVLYKKHLPFCPRGWGSSPSSHTPLPGLWLWSGVPVFSTQTVFPARPYGWMPRLNCLPGFASDHLWIQALRRKCQTWSSPVRSDLIIFPLRAQCPISTTKPQGLRCTILAVAFLLNLSFHDSFWVNPT